MRNINNNNNVIYKLEIVLEYIIEQNYKIGNIRKFDFFYHLKKDIYDLTIDGLTKVIGIVTKELDIILTRINGDKETVIFT